jgi:Mor family transcriptional regulator
MTRSDHTDVIAQLFERLHNEFGRLAPQIIQVMVEVVGGYRMTFPDFHDLYRAERNRRIRNEFNGGNHAELGIKYRLKPRQIRRIVQGG